MVHNNIAGPQPQSLPMLAGNGQQTALKMDLLNTKNASALSTLAGGSKRKKSRTRMHRRTKTRKLKRRKSLRYSNKRRTKRLRLYKGGATNVIPYSTPVGSSPAELNIGGALAKAHAAAYTNASYDSRATNAP